MTQELFRDDSYLKATKAIVADVTENAVILDQTVFYPTGGGQPGDSGLLTCETGESFTVITTQKNREDGKLHHILADGETPPAIGTELTATIDWDRRYRLMRMHSALHILCSKVDGAVTGGSIGEEKGRLDFDLTEAPDKEALEQLINSVVDADIPLQIGAISDEELIANPDLIRTMSVKPPMGQGSVRTIRIEGVDYQPCGGTHIKSTGEIGRLKVGKVEKKGKQNRRINIHFAE